MINRRTFIKSVLAATAAVSSIGKAKTVRTVSSSTSSTTSTATTPSYMSRELYPHGYTTTTRWYGYKLGIPYTDTEAWKNIQKHIQRRASND